MKVLAIASFVALAAAQVTINPDGTATCPSSSSPEAFCAGTSLQTNIIIRCVGTVGQPGNCNDNLAGVPPVGVKIFAPCYQSSATAGDAACSYNGIAYPDNAPPFAINGTSTSSSTTITTSTVGSLNTGTPIGTGGVPVGTGGTGTGGTGTGGISPTGGAGSGSGGSPGGYNATGTGNTSPPTPTSTIAIGAASSNTVASLVVVLAMSVFAMAL